MGKPMGTCKWLFLTWLLCGFSTVGANPGSKKPLVKPVESEASSDDDLTPGTAKSLDIPPSPSPAEGRRTAKSSIKYVFKKDTFLQILKIAHLDKNRITFEVSLAGRCEFTYAGAAINEQGDQGTEVDEDEDGNLYSIDEYIHEGKDGCFLKIRVDSDSEEKVRLVGLSCKRSCRINEDVVLHRDK